MTQPKNVTITPKGSGFLLVKKADEVLSLALSDKPPSQTLPTSIRATDFYSLVK